MLWTIHIVNVSEWTNKNIVVRTLGEFEIVTEHCPSHVVIWTTDSVSLPTRFAQMGASLVSMVLRGFAGQLLGVGMATQWLLCVMNSFKLAQNRFWAWVHKIQLYGKFLLKKWMLSGNLNGETHIKVNSSGNSDAEKTKADFATWYKKRKKSAYEKEDKKIALPMCEKNGPDSPSGLARTARSARLRFCLFRRFVFIQGVCLSRRAQRADLFKTSIRLSAKGVKYRDKSRRVWGVV